jgi:GT2 family glycosyltransferase
MSFAVAEAGNHSLVSYLIVSRNRCSDLREAVNSILAQEYQNKEIIVVDNGSDDATGKLFETEFNQRGITYVRSDKNLGVSGGRNLGLMHIKGEIIINLDDDAVLRDTRATEKIVGEFQANGEIGVLGFKIVDYRTGALEKGAFPSKNKNRNADKEFETSWFIGAGHAILRDAHRKAGVYRDFFPYGHEELDLSFRILEAGYKIIYFPEIQIFHKKVETRSLLSDTGFQAQQLFNRIKVAMFNLPVRYILTTAAARSAQVLIMTRGNVMPIFIASWRIVIHMFSICEERKVLSKATIKKILEMKGPIIY